MERELFICRCASVEHQLVFSWFEDEYEGDVCATVHLRRLRFWQRLWRGVRYIFGHQSKYGAFDEFIFRPEEALTTAADADYYTPF